MSRVKIAFRMPRPGWPRATVETDLAFAGACLRVAGREVVEAPDRASLERGYAADGYELKLQGGDLTLTVDREPALREDRLQADPSRSAWIHAWLALIASFFGFVSSYLYLGRADGWSVKMAIHMAAWHGLLTLTLFPASVWGQRAGIRAVQGVSFLFFLIHLGIAAANTGETDVWVALLNAASGVSFLAATLYGQRAHRDMDPLAALLEQPPPP